MENQEPTYSTTQENRPLQTPPPPPDNLNIGPKTAYPTPRFMSKRMAIIFLGIIVLMFVISIGAYLFGKNSNKETVISPSPTPIATPTPDPTADWKTYTGNGFTFKYPSYWNVETAPSNYYQVKLSRKYMGGNESQTLSQYESDITIYFEPIKKNTTLEDWLYIRYGIADQAMLQPLKSESKKIKIDGQDAITTKTPGIFYGIKAVAIDQGLGFDFNLTTREDEKDIIDFNQILSTFKFTDQSPTPTCRPRPACFDATPSCLMPETSDMCPPSPTPGN